MKKNIKRILTLVMVMTMVLSCTAIASAVEVNSVDNDVPVEVGVNATSNLSISPLYYGKLTNDLYGNSVTTSGTFSLESTTYVTLVVNCKVNGTVTIYNSNSVYRFRDFSAPGGQFTVGNKLPAGDYSYVLTFPDNTQTWGYQFVATDSFYG